MIIIIIIRFFRINIPINPEFKLAVVFQNVGVSESLQYADFVVDVTLTVLIFNGHCFSIPLRQKGFKNFTVSASTEKTVAFPTKTNSQTSVVNQLKFTARAALEFDFAGGSGFVERSLIDKVALTSKRNFEKFINDLLRSVQVSLV